LFNVINNIVYYYVVLKTVTAFKKLGEFFGKHN